MNEQIKFIVGIETVQKVRNGRRWRVIGKGKPKFVASMRYAETGTDFNKISLRSKEEAAAFGKLRAEEIATILRSNRWGFKDVFIEAKVGA
jgi:hypothetical protein